MDKTHPEGLGYEPLGHGFSGTVNPGFSAPHPLLTRRNIESTKRNHPEDWTEARMALPAPTRDPRTGRLNLGFSDDERDRLATLSVLVQRGLYNNDRLVTQGERIAMPAKDECDCEHCDGDCDARREHDEAIDQIREAHEARLDG